MIITESSRQATNVKARHGEARRKLLHTGAHILNLRVAHNPTCPVLQQLAVAVLHLFYDLMGCRGDRIDRMLDGLECIVSGGGMHVQQGV